MEIEAKFAIPDVDTMLRLQQVARLGPYVPGTMSWRHVRDLYLDTESRKLYQGGLACRLRGAGSGWAITLKGLGDAQSGIHQRLEDELVLAEPPDIDPHSWPEWEGRERILSLIGDEPLQRLFVVEQKRCVCPLFRGERLIAELSLDEGHLQAGSRSEPFLVLEIELAGEGTMEDLYALIEHLASTWGLVPEHRSKFQLGMAVLDRVESPSNAGEGRLSTRERELLVQIADTATDERSQNWARLLLGWDRGTSIRQLCRDIGLSRSWAYELVQRFREQRMAVFPSEAREHVASSPFQGHRAEAASQKVDVYPPERQERRQQAVLPVETPEMTIPDMCERFQVDMPHARRVADNALALFDATATIHRLDLDRRRLLEVMGLLHNVGMEADPVRHHVVGSEIVREHPLQELSGVEQRMLAAAIYLHRKRIKQKRLENKAVASLPPSIYGDTLTLAALLRIADGLDDSQTQSTSLEHVQVTGAAVYLSLSGPFAEADAAQAQAKADLWERLFELPILVAGPETDAQEEIDALGEAAERGGEQGSDKSPGVLPGDSMGEAGRKVLRYHLQSMLEHERGTRAGENIEELHDMRVATRRMRAAFRVFGPYFKAQAIRPYLSGLRRAARALGGVRDLDVFMEKASAYLERLPPEQAHDLDPLIGVWEAQRDQARVRMAAYLDSAKYQDFVQAFQVFVESPGSGLRTRTEVPPVPILVAHVAPELIYARWAGVQAFGPLLEGAPIALLHALRIECKRLRYALEFFREVLGPDAKMVIEEVVRLQDHLGDLHDADVANHILSDFLFASPGTVSDRLLAPGVVAYLAIKQRELQVLIESFPEAWASFNRPEVRQWLAGAVAAL
jgi:CHAD domain-containing protein/inorganic triphosphatase YgiF